jgi:2,3-bisphosphoglycerate-independent phosphoglycerate mutase
VGSALGPEMGGWGGAQVPSFEARHGIRAFMIAPTCIIAGLGMTIGMGAAPAPLH